MKETNRTMNAEESLKLIRNMIENTRTQVERNSGRPFLVMGYLTVFVSLAVWYGIRTSGDYSWNLLWFLIPAVGLAWGLQARSERRSGTSTCIDRILGQVWTVFGIAGFAQSLLSIWVTFSVLYVIILMMGMGTALTGLIIRSRLLAASGFSAALFWAPLCMYFDGTDRILVCAAAFAAMMVIPGHVLEHRERRARKSKNQTSACSRN